MQIFSFDQPIIPLKPRIGNPILIMDFFIQSLIVYFKAGRTDSVRINNLDFLVEKGFSVVPIIMIIPDHLTMHADWNDIPSHKNLADIL